MKTHRNFPGIQPKALVCSIAACLLVLSASHSPAQESSNPPVRVAFLEDRADVLKRFTSPDEDTGFEVQVNTTTNIMIRSALVDFDAGSLDESTPVQVTVGGFTHEATLGDSDNWQPGRNSARFGFYVDGDEFDENGDPVQILAGTIVYVWNAHHLSVRVTGSGIGSVIAGSAADLFDGVESSKLRFLTPADASVTFGDQTSSGALFAKGHAKHITKDGGDFDTTYDLYRLHAVSFYDRVAPTVTITDPPENAVMDSEDLTISGIARDNLDATSSLVLTKAVVNGMDVTGTVEPSFDDGDDTEDPAIPPGFSVTGILLKAGRNSIKLFVSDSSGNSAVIKRHVTYTGAEIR